MSTRPAVGDILQGQGRGRGADRRTLVLAKLRNRRFHCLAELNAAIGDLLIRLNEERPIRRLGVTRRRLLEELDRPALKPLPIEPYVFAEWRVRRVGIDYHVDVFLKKFRQRGLCHIVPDLRA